jgi:hypothetical protein
MAAMQRRLHPRVRLRLPARLRWSAPLGQRREECETANVSRGGLLIAARSALGPGHPLWVTFPFDSEDPGAQPETVARVVRCTQTSLFSWNVAIQFEVANLHSPKKIGSLFSSTVKTNGNGSRNLMALPIRVRPPDVPWHEETMTVEVSPSRLKFRTNREYRSGEKLLVSFATKSDAPWSGDAEWETEITSIEARAGCETLQVTVRRK